MPKESTQELRETRSGRRYPTPRHSRNDSSEEEPRGHSRKRARAEPKSSAADAAPASPLRLATVTEDEAEQEETQRASQEHEAIEQEQEETQHASQDADQHHPVVFIPSAEHSSSSEHARASVLLPEPPTAEHEQTAEPEETPEPEPTTEPVPEQTTIEPLETTTTEPEVTTSDPVQATTTEPAEPSEPEPAQSELQQTGTEPEAAEQRQTGPPGYQEVRSHSTDIDPGNPAFTAAAGCWFNRCSQDASASGIRAFQNPTCSPCRVLRLTCSPGHRHEHYCHASSSGSGSGFRASQNPTCSPGHRHEHDCKASSSGSGSSFRASQNAPHRHEFHVIAIYLVWQSETKEVLKLTRQAFYERIFPAAGKLVPEHKPSESRRKMEPSVSRSAPLLFFDQFSRVLSRSAGFGERAFGFCAYGDYVRECGHEPYFGALACREASFGQFGRGGEGFSPGAPLTPPEECARGETADAQREGPELTRLGLKGLEAALPGRWLRRWDPTCSRLRNLWPVGCWSASVPHRGLPLHAGVVAAQINAEASTETNKLRKIWAAVVSCPSQAAGPCAASLGPEVVAAQLDGQRPLSRGDKVERSLSRRGEGSQRPFRPRNRQQKRPRQEPRPKAPSLDRLRLLALRPRTLLNRRAVDGALRSIKVDRRSPTARI
ncbi:hypothetical protein PAPYR_13130 [Paratrimastix pyriformis]|uniref:Uncharacterized protein n=1 Tax=Paratrimastix pyriformis TaxID=342808 RepID=A0ABQ8U366_9EUKA|nr:hypothetical protein PAPYR_13130 [Paratrimastix pyriformis]